MTEREREYYSLMGLKEDGFVWGLSDAEKCRMYE